MAETIIPTSPEELEEMLNDEDRMAPVLKDRTEFARWVKTYAKAQVTKNNGELAKQTRELVQAGLQEFFQDQRQEGHFAGAARPNLHDGFPAGTSARAIAAARRGKLYNKKALGNALHGEKLSAAWGDFLPAIHHRAEQTPEIAAFRKVIKNAMSERVPSEGGFLVPENLRSDILMLAIESAVVRSRARVIPMDSLRVPYPTIDDPTHVGQVYGGVVGYWTEEAAALVGSQPTFGRIVLEARKLTGYTEIPNELLQDSNGALDQFFSEMFPEALAFFEDLAFLTGSGVGEPLGILNGDCAINIGRSTANEVLFTDIVGMYTRMLPQSLNRAVWLCSPDVIAQLLQLVLESGGTPVAPPLWLQSMNIGESIVYSILGRPLIVTEKVSALGTRGDIAFVDMGYYLLGDRQVMQVASSEDYKFQQDLTSFRVIERVDGRPWLRSALTPANGSANTLSPTVVLD